MLRLSYRNSYSKEHHSPVLVGASSSCCDATKNQLSSPWQGHLFLTLWNQRKLPDKGSVSSQRTFSLFSFARITKSPHGFLDAQGTRVLSTLSRLALSVMERQTGTGPHDLFSLPCIRENRPASVPWLSCWILTWGRVSGDQKHLKNQFVQLPVQCLNPFQY